MCRTARLAAHWHADPLSSCQRLAHSLGKSPHPSSTPFRLSTSGFLPPCRPSVSPTRTSCTRCRGTSCSVRKRSTKQRWSARASTIGQRTASRSQRLWSGPPTSCERNGVMSAARLCVWAIVGAWLLWRCAAQPVRPAAMPVITASFYASDAHLACVCVMCGCT